MKEALKHNQDTTQESTPSSSSTTQYGKNSCLSNLNNDQNYTTNNTNNNNTHKNTNETETENTSLNSNNKHHNEQNEQNKENNNSTNNTNTTKPTNNDNTINNNHKDNDNHNDNNKKCPTTQNGNCSMSVSPSPDGKKSTHTISNPITSHCHSPVNAANSQHQHEYEQQQQQCESQATSPEVTILGSMPPAATAVPNGVANDIFSNNSPRSVHSVHSIHSARSGHSQPPQTTRVIYSLLTPQPPPVQRHCSSSQRTFNPYLATFASRLQWNQRIKQQMIYQNMLRNYQFATLHNASINPNKNKIFIIGATGNNTTPSGTGGRKNNENRNNNTSNNTNGNSDSGSPLSSGSNSNSNINRTNETTGKNSSGNSSKSNEDTGSSSSSSTLLSCVLSNSSGESSNSDDSSPKINRAPIELDSQTPTNTTLDFGSLSYLSEENHENNNNNDNNNTNNTNNTKNKNNSSDSKNNKGSPNAETVNGNNCCQNCKNTNKNSTTTIENENENESGNENKDKTNHAQACTQTPPQAQIFMQIPRGVPMAMHTNCALLTSHTPHANTRAKIVGKPLSTNRIHHNRTNNRNHISVQTIHHPSKNIYTHFTGSNMHSQAGSGNGTPNNQHLSYYNPNLSRMYFFCSRIFSRFFDFLLCCCFNCLTFIGVN